MGLFYKNKSLGYIWKGKFYKSENMILGIFQISNMTSSCILNIYNEMLIQTKWKK